VEVDVTHTYRGDLRVVLLHDGTEAVLMNNEGGSADDIRQSFATTSFDGRDASGTWTLKVIDSAAQDTGTLNRWTLTIAR
jgi:subtilisin-like proprotein convertase family protein